MQGYGVEKIENNVEVGKKERVKYVAKKYRNKIKKERVEKQTDQTDRHKYERTKKQPIAHAVK